MVLLAVTETPYAYDSDDLMYTVYEDPMDGVYEEDIIRVRGECMGSYSYISQAGWGITVPSMIVEYWERL